MKFILLVAVCIIGGAGLTFPAKPTRQPIAQDIIQENKYDELRKIAFSATPESLKLSLPENKTVVYGVIMDWEMNGAIVTTVSFSTGDASLYLSTGTMVIGGFKHPGVNSASKSFVDKAQTYLKEAQKATGTDVPQHGEIKFFFLTNKGLFSATDQMRHINDKSSRWTGLFEEANKVLTQLRIASSK